MSTEIGDSREPIAMEDKIWLGALVQSVRDVEKSGKNILAYGFYEELNVYSNDASFVPFILSKDDSRDLKGIEDIAIFGGEPVKFNGSFFELGEWGLYTGKVSKDRIAVRKTYQDNRGAPDIVCIGQRVDDHFYQGFWGIGGSDYWNGNFKLIFDIESTFNFDR